MNSAVTTLAANMKRAATDRKSVTIGGGIFTPAELESGAKALAAHDDLVEQLLAALPFVEDLENDSGYKAGSVKKRIASIRAALAKAGAI